MNGSRAQTSALEIDHLKVRYPVGRHTLFNRATAPWLTAVNDVSLTVPGGQALGIVGESGCGKSTLARTIAGLATPSTGSLHLGETELEARRSRDVSRRIQMVFQDPASSLNPRMTIREMLTEVLKVHRIVDKADLENRLKQMMSLVELPESVLDRRPRALSGGQRQRVGIARALAPEPELLILDEAIAALDVSVQAAVLALLASLREQLNLTMIFISHDLGAIRTVCDRVAVMYLGRIVEHGPVEEVLRRPRHPYTKALLVSEPSLDNPRRPGASGLQGELPSAINLPPGCSFKPRCSRAQDSCAQAVPAIDMDAGHDQACFFPLERLREQPDSTMSA